MHSPHKSAACPAGLVGRDGTPRRQNPPVDPPASPTLVIADTLYRGVIAMIIAAFVLTGLMPAHRAQAAEAVMSPGDAVVTGFSGFRPSGAPPIPGGNLLDGFVINVDGPSAQIQSLSLFGEPPQGQLVSPGLRKQIFAREIGQVFPIALMENEDTATPPSILLGATSMFGLHIVNPDSNGDGFPERIKVGQPGAIWMPGMFADDKGGAPGAIWRVDGQTGDVALFATIPDNSGPGLGDVVFDKKTRHVFVSDLDTGLIHRLDETGQLVDTFDHGVDGRPAKGLAPVSDDGTQAEINTPAFDVEKPETWGFTPFERRVHGMAVHQARLYYTAGHKVWSIGINDDGSFAGDPRWELDVAATTPDTQLSDMLFDAKGRMYVAERGAQRGSYDYSEFAEAEKAEVKRYILEEPDDPATESRWMPDPEIYAIGLPAEHRHSNGGITLGFPYDEAGALKTGACGEFLWTTGERLRAGELAQGDGGEGDPAANADVHGLQGNAIDAVRPDNVPPMTSYFTDYDSFFGDPEKAGHMGDVEIWQPCDGVQTFGELPPWWIPPTTELPPDYPPEFPPPEYSYDTNLELTKRAIPNSCWSWGNDWVCRYRIRIRNTGPDDYFGDIQIRDWFPANPAGLATLFQPQPPWFCWNPGGNPAETRCWRPNVFLPSGNSVFMTVWAKVPKAPRRCRLTNVAEIEWAPGGSQWNTDPTDDIDSATAIIPDPECEPDEPKRTNLELKKRAMQCWIVGNDVDCGFHVTVENVGANDFFGPITVRDQMPAGVLFQWAPGFKWNCAAAAGPGTTFECTTKNPANVFLQPTDKVDLWVYGRVSIAQAKQFDCKLPNRAWIVDPLGAPKNTDATDDADSATAQMPPELCKDDHTNLRLTKTASPEMCSTGPAGGDYFCRYLIRVINEGPGAYNGNLHVRDTFPAGTQLLLGPGPWTCDPQVGNTRLCKLNGVVMPAMTARSFPVWLKVPVDVARQHECRIRNVAKIIVAPGGSPMNTNAADDEDDAVSTIPADVCQPPPPETNLKITKHSSGTCPREGQGFKCDWTIDVQNTGPGDFNGNIILNETLPGEPVDASWNALWSCVGAGGGGGAICTHNNASIPSGGHIELNLSTLFSLEQVRQLQCNLVNLVEIAQPAGNTPKNTDASDDTAQAAASVDPAVCQTYPPPPEPQQCPPGYRYDDGECVPKRQPPGVITPPPPVIPPVVDVDCPYGMNEVSSLRAHYLRQQGWTVRRYQGLWCVKPPREPDCPYGYEEVPRSRIDVLREKGWTVTRAGRGKWCGKEPPPQSCPHGMRPVPGSRVPYLRNDGWSLTRLPNGKWCGRPGAKCPRGTHLDDGRCVPDKTCKPPLVGTWPICKPPFNPDDDCRKSGGIWNGKRCVHGVKCWDGSTAPSQRQCPPRTHKCSDGSVLPIGKSCPPVRQPCGHGFTGFKPNCKPIVKPCPSGTVGPGQPNCRKIPVRIPCPHGTIGKYQPNCKKIQRPAKPVKPKPAKPVRIPCPRGTIGKYQPNCKKIPKPFKPAKPIFKPGQKSNLR